MRWQTLGAASLVVLLAACGGVKEPPKAVASSGPDPRATTFVAKGCNDCHSIPLLGIMSVTDLGPNLDDAYQHVPERVGLTLDEYFRAPTGTMQAVLRSQIRLSGAERDSIVRILKQLHVEHEVQEGPGT
jgi:hypothetical protein